MRARRSDIRPQWVGRAAPPRNQRGVNQSVSLALVTPLVLLAILGVVQAGLWMHANTVATRAAQAGADAARSLQGTDRGAIEVATRIAHGNGLDSVQVRARQGPEQVSVVVRAAAPLVLVPLTVEATATAPRERVSQP